jgi:hypothetical protein
MAVITRNVDLSVVGANGGGWVTDLNAATPTAPTTHNAEPAAGFLPLGAVSEEGLGYGFDEDSQSFVAWGQLTPYRTQITRSLRTFTVQLWETNRAICKSVMYRVPVADVTPNVTGDFTFEETASPAPDRRAWIFDVVDGLTLERFYVPVGEVTDRDDVAFRPDEMAAYSLTVTAYADSSGVTVYHLGHVNLAGS